MKARKSISSKLKTPAIVTSVIYTLASVGFFAYVFYIDAHKDEITIALGVVVLVVAFIVSFILNHFMVRSLAKPLVRLKDIMKKISEGDFNVRLGIKSNDEYGDISGYLDNILEDRLNTLNNMADENEQLNDSIVSLLGSVVQLAQKNLTIKAKVNEDITGPLSDALNLMTSETTKVLNEVSRISGEIAETSNLIKSQSDNVLLLSDAEQYEVEETTTELDVAVQVMGRISELAEESNNSAEDVIKTTIIAMTSVNETVDSINAIRNSIREAEKRIKRLGERSQEINTAVNLISNISERTHILALNASMHAASAGEAGRGFAVVADEVQRLAENAREATSEIGTLVNNIQMETVGTVKTMNELISQVVGGSQLAEKAGDQMKKTQVTTTELVSMVQRIYENALQQVDVSKKLQDRTDTIRESVRKTSAHLHEQTSYTDELVDQSIRLLSSVGVFQLPESKSDD